VNACTTWDDVRPCSLFRRRRVLVGQSVDMHRRQNVLTEKRMSPVGEDIAICL
jgi:hypothetical protein